MENAIETPEGKQDASQRFLVEIPEGIDDFSMTSGAAACLGRVNLIGLSIYLALRASELIRPIALLRGLTAPLTLIHTHYASFVITRVLRATLHVTP